MAIPPVQPVGNIRPTDSIVWPEDLLAPPLPRRYLPFPLPARLAPAEVDPFRLIDPNLARDGTDDFVLRTTMPAIPDRMVLLSDRFLLALRDALTQLDTHLKQHAGGPASETARRAHAVLADEIALREWVASCRSLLQAA